MLREKKKTEIKIIWPPETLLAENQWKKPLKLEKKLKQNKTKYRVCRAHLQQQNFLIPPLSKQLPTRSIKHWKGFVSQFI